MLITYCNSTVRDPVLILFFVMEALVLLLNRSMCAIMRCNFYRDEYLVKNSSVFAVVENEKDETFISGIS